MSQAMPSLFVYSRSHYPKMGHMTSMPASASCLHFLQDQAIEFKAYYSLEVLENSHVSKARKGPFYAVTTIIFSR